LVTLTVSNRAHMALLEHHTLPARVRKVIKYLFVGLTIVRHGYRGYWTFLIR
jgi:hypothetical protein